MNVVSDLRSLMVTVLIAITAWNASQASSGVSSRQNSIQDPACQKQLDEIYSAEVTVPSPPKLSGLWTSTQCEVRPGPEYLIRKYRFFDSGLFELTQFYFWDSHCHRPSFAVEARGQFKIYQASWIILGATEVDYHPRYVTLVPYTTDAAALLELHLNATPCRLQSPWQPFERHVIFHYVEDDDSQQAADEDAALSPHEDGVVDCLSSLDLSFHELQLVRIEEQHIGPDLQRTLLLGDVHPDRTQRTTYRPTGYQQPLAATETVGCRICRLVGKASDAYPPQLPIRQRPSGVSHLLPGSWVSQRCETRNYGIFLTRNVRFYDDRLLWERREFYFADGLCQKLRFTLALSGTYRLDDKTSVLLEDAFNIDIQVRQMKLTINDRSLLRQLNLARSCGGQPEVTWDVGVEHDVTSSNGCAPLDVTFHPAERDVILIDRGTQQQTLLYLGQPPSMGSQESQTRGRPTSFLPPLVRCSGRDDLGGPGQANRLPYIGENPDARARSKVAGSNRVTGGALMVVTFVFISYTMTLITSLSS